MGICGGVWSKKKDVRLGDVIVSQPDGTHGGVVQWDFGKLERDGVFRRTGTLNKPPRPLLNRGVSLPNSLPGPRERERDFDMLPAPPRPVDC